MTPKTNWPFIGTWTAIFLLLCAITNAIFRLLQRFWLWAGDWITAHVDAITVAVFVLAVLALYVIAKRAERNNPSW